MADDNIRSFPTAACDPNSPLPPPMNDMSNGLGFDDIEAAFNMRGWLQKACEVQGAKMVGGGFGGGVADLQIELEGHQFWLTIKSIDRT